MSSESDQMSPATTDGLAGRGKVSRRDFLKIGALTGAALGVGGGLTGALAACGSDSGSTAAAARRRPRDQGGLRDAAHRPARLLRHPDAWCVKQWKPPWPAASSAATARSTPSRSSSRTRSLTPTAPPRSRATSSPTTAVDIIMAASTPTPCRRSPTSVRPCRCPACPTTARGRPTSSAAAATPPRASSGPTTLVGPRGHHRHLRRHVGLRCKTNKKVGEMWPNDADGLVWADPKTGQPPISQAGRLHRRRRRPLPGPQRGLLLADQQVQVRRLRHRQRRHASRRTSPTSGSSRFQQGFKPLVTPPWARRSSSRRARGPRRHRLRSLLRVLVVPEPSVHVLADRPDVQGTRRPYETVTRQAVDPADPALRGLRGRRRRAQAHHQRGRQAVIRDAINATDMQTIGGHITWSGRTRRSTRCRTSAPRRSRAASGSRVTSTRTTSSWSTTRRLPKSRPRANCSPSPTERPDSAVVSSRVRTPARRRRTAPGPSSRVPAPQALPWRGVGGIRLPPEGGCPFPCVRTPVPPRPHRPLRRRGRGRFGLPTFDQSGRNPLPYRKME